MSRRCANAACEYPSADCLRRSEFPDPTQCEDWLAGSGSDEPAPSEAQGATPAAVEPISTLRFWSGHALGSSEAAGCLLDVPTSLVVVAGAEEAGKTCLLVSQFLEICQGRTPGFPYRFCGSRTLRAFEHLADLAWEWSGNPEDRILPRTTRGSHREPGFLHYAFKPRVGGESVAVEDRRRDVLLTDLPGEWFGRWAEHAVEGRRLMPFLGAATAYWVVVDTPRVLKDRSARREAEDLIGRVAKDARPGQRVDLIFCKADAVRDAPLSSSAAQADAWGPAKGPIGRMLRPLDGARGEVGVWTISAFPGRVGEVPPRGVLDPLSAALEEIPVVPRPAPPRTGDRYFQLYRGGTP